MAGIKRILASVLCFSAALGAFGDFATRGDDSAATAERSTRPIAVATRTEQLEAPTGRKAFLVAADDYRDASDLAYVKNDVEALAARLIDLGFEEKNVAVLKTGGDFDAFPTKDNIEERFATFIESLRPGDFVIVYLSGHGIQPANSNEAFFAPIDVKASDPFGSSVSIDRMLTALERSAANFRWMIVDACRNDPTNARTIFKTRSARDAKGLTSIANAPRSTALLQSCQPGKFSYEGGDGVTNGVFTLSLLEALDKNNPKADADGDGALAFSEVLKYVAERTDELASQHHNASQKPNLSGEITDFAILDGLLIEGLTREKWEEANALYLEACALRRNRDYLAAAQKLAEAREINAVNEGYKATEAEIAEILASRTAFQNALEAANEAERLAREAVANAVAAGATAEERAEAERKAREAAEAKRRAEEAAASFDKEGATPESAGERKGEKKMSRGWKIATGFFFAGVTFVPIGGILVGLTEILFAVIIRRLNALGGTDIDSISEETFTNVSLTIAFCILWGAGFMYAETTIVQATCVLGGLFFLVTIAF